MVDCRPVGERHGGRVEADDDLIDLGGIEQGDVDDPATRVEDHRFEQSPEPVDHPVDRRGVE